MSPADIAIFFFFILVTTKAVIDSVDYWKNDEEASERITSPAAHVPQAHRRPSARPVPIKRIAADRGPVRRAA